MGRPRLTVCILAAACLVQQARVLSQSIEPLSLRDDDAPRRALTSIVRGSHVKVSIPSLPYLYTSHAINGALIKPSDNERGWEYDMATSHRQIDSTTYEFTLRRGVQFQDGTPFNADAVVLNMEYFKKAPVRYSKIDKVFDRAEKIDDYTVRFFLKEKYGSFMNDAIWMQFYTEHYLKTNANGWNGKATCPNLSMPGPYGLGPYILTEGYIEGDRQTAKAVLKANPHYWDKSYPKSRRLRSTPNWTAKRPKEGALRGRRAGHHGDSAGGQGRDDSRPVQQAGRFRLRRTTSPST